MAETRAIHDLYAIMNDGTAGIATRLRAAVSASRVEPLAMANESEPPAVVFLRSIVASEHAGLRFHPDYRREAAAALAYYERRCRKVELMYAVPDTDERKREWRAIINGALRVRLDKMGHWPERKDVLFTAADTFEMPAADPETVLSAVLLPTAKPKERRRQRAIDERVPSGSWYGTAAERLELLRLVASAAAERLRECGVAG